MKSESGGDSHGLRRYLAMESGWPGAVAYAILAAALVWGISLVWPSGYRAEARVLVHHNVERAVEDPTSDEAAGYIDREVAVLESLAFSDGVWQAVAGGLTPVQRAPAEFGRILENVRLPHPKDGEWRFQATTQDPALSARVANVWAEAFVTEANRSVAAAVNQEAWASRVLEEGRALAALQAECAEWQAALEDLAGTEVALRQADPQSASLTAEEAQLTRLARMAGVDPAGSPSTVAEQLDLAESLKPVLTASREACLSRLGLLEGEWEGHKAEAAEWAAEEMTLSPLLEVSLLSSATLPAGPVTRPEVALGIGTLVGLCAWLVRVLMRTANAPLRGRVG